MITLSTVTKSNEILLHINKYNNSNDDNNNTKHNNYSNNICLEQLRILRL